MVKERRRNGMTFGQLFMIMNPNVTVRENGTCVWLYFDDVNYYTIGTEWWDKEIPDNAIAVLKWQEPVEPIADHGVVSVTYRCGNCKTHFYLKKQKYCAICGRKVKWDD